MPNMNLYDIANTLCIPVDYIHNGATIRVPFLGERWGGYEQTLMEKLKLRQSGGEEIPMVEWVMASSINDFIKQQDGLGLKNYLASFDMFNNPDLTWNEQEILLYALFVSLPKIYGD